MEFLTRDARLATGRLVRVDLPRRDSRPLDVASFAWRPPVSWTAFVEGLRQERSHRVREHQSSALRPVGPH